jgi:hypothetical protein
MGGFPISGYVAFGNLESHPRRVAVRGLGVIDGCHQQSCRSVLSRDCIAQISCEGCDPTLPGKMISDNSYTHWMWMAGDRLQR